MPAFTCVRRRRPQIAHDIETLRRRTGDGGSPLPRHGVRLLPACRAEGSCPRATLRMTLRDRSLQLRDDRLIAVAPRLNRALTSCDAPVIARQPSRGQPAEARARLLQLLQARLCGAIFYARTRPRMLGLASLRKIPADSAGVRVWGRGREAKNHVWASTHLNHSRRTSSSTRHAQRREQREAP